MVLAARSVIRHIDRQAPGRSAPPAGAAQDGALPGAPPVVSPTSPPAPSDLGNLSLLRKIDGMILSNLAFGYIAEEVVNVLPGRGALVGGTLRVVDQQTGNLEVLAISKTLSAPKDGLSLAKLKGTTVAPSKPEQIDALTAQALNGRRIASGERLTQAACPPLEQTEADQIQEHFGIKSLFVYPIVVEGRLNGALTFYLDVALADTSASDEEFMQSITDELGIALANASLTRQLGEINAKLEDANAHLQQMDAMKDEFISIASHQLRSPLTAIKGYLSMLLDNDFGPVPKQHKPVLAQVKQSTNEVINLINDMLSVSRINAQKFELTKAPVHLEEIISDVVNELSALATARSLALKLELPVVPLGELTFDPLRIRQVLINFIDNAIKYTERGTVTVSLSKEEGDVVLKVHDTGIGIPKGELDRMFTKFYRAENARQMITSGSGLGLFVAKRIIEDHHATPIIESVEGSGSTFGFRVPVAAVTVARDTAAPAGLALEKP